MTLTFTGGRTFYNQTNDTLVFDTSSESDNETQETGNSGSTDPSSNPSSIPSTQGSHILTGESSLPSSLKQQKKVLKLAKIESFNLEKKKK